MGHLASENRQNATRAILDFDPPAVGVRVTRSFKGSITEWLNVPPDPMKDAFVIQSLDGALTPLESACRCGLSAKFCELMRQLPYSGIQTPINLILAIIDFGAGRVGGHMLPNVDGLHRRFFDGGVDSAADARQQRRAQRRALGFLQGHQLFAVNIGLDLAPQYASRPAARGANLLHRNPEFLED